MDEKKKVEHVVNMPSPLECLSTIVEYQYIPLFLFKQLVSKGTAEEEPGKEDVRRLAFFLDHLIEYKCQRSLKVVDYNLLIFLFGVDRDTLLPKRYVALVRLYEILQTPSEAFATQLPNALERIQSILAHSWKSAVLCKLLRYIQGEGVSRTYESWSPKQKETWSLLW